MISKLGLGGGCHWCTEAVFQHIPGVKKVAQGYLKSTFPYESWSEGVIIEFQPTVDLELLIDIHLQTHQSLVNHSRRTIYRSAIYYVNEQDISEIEQVMISLSQKRNQDYITQTIPFIAFKSSPEHIRDYYHTRPDAPFCTRYIAPKLDQVNEMLEAKNN
jgi:peptide-methionine (S)-S-oxide reductase